MPSTHAALLVDPDPQGLESLVYGFQGADWRITACPTPETASLLVKASGAEAVVIASRADHDKMQTLVRQLRGKEAYRTLSILVLGPESLRQTLKERGDVDLLPLPAFVREVITACELLVTTNATAAQKPGEEPSFELPIAATKTLSFLRTLNGLARSGTLRLDRKGRSGEVLFHEGELTAAQTGQLQGMAAVQHMLAWNDGKTGLRLHPVARRGQIHANAEEFLEELDRFQRDFAHAIKDIGPTSAVYACVEERLQKSGADVPAEVTPVVRLCDGQRSVSDIIDASPFRVLDTVRILGRLVDLGILSRKPAQAGATSLDKRSHEDFLSTARILGPGGEPSKSSSATLPVVAPAPTTSAPVVAPRTEPSTSTSGVMEVKPSGKTDGRERKRTLEMGVPLIDTSALTGASSILAAAPASPSTASASTSSTASPAMTGAPAAKPKAEVGAKDAGGKEVGAKVETLHPGSNTVRLFSSLPVAEPAPAPVTHAAGTLPPQQPRATESSAKAKASPVAPAPAATVGSLPSAVQVAHGPLVSGTIEAQPSARKSQSAMRAVRASVVLDAQPVETIETPRPVPVHAPATSSSGEMPSVRVTGEMHVAPSRKTESRVPASDRVSVHLENAMTTDFSAPSSASISSSEMRAESVGTRITGEMRVAPSGRTSRSMGQVDRASGSFQIDPSLAAPTAPLPAPTPAAPVEPPAKRTDSRPIVAEQAQSRSSTGNFSPLEKDFFSREADLYKTEGEESFADLDEGRGKNGKNGKNGNGKDDKKRSRG